MDRAFDEQIMRRCLQLAEKGLGTTYPNPMVGSVIVHNGIIIGEGWHQKAGWPHAEVNAINSVKDKNLFKESTIYVTLEPCSHYGKTPPCSDMIIELGIPKVVVGTLDPNAKVNGRGIKRMTDAGLDVSVGILEEECRELNKRFFTLHRLKRPYIILKWAQTSDGFISPEGNVQKWITNSYSKQLVHQWRTQEQGILVGRKTAEADNPQLNVRLWSGKSPVRIVIDRSLKLRDSLHLFDGSQPTLVFTEKEIKSEIENLEYIPLDFNSDLGTQIADELYKRGIQSLIVEGGQKTLETFIDSGLWDEIRIFTSEAEWGSGTSSPKFNGRLVRTQMLETDKLEIYSK